jgi:hypothetical protein
LGTALLASPCLPVSLSALNGAILSGKFFIKFLMSD